MAGRPQQVTVEDVDENTEMGISRGISFDSLTAKETPSVLNTINLRAHPQ